jgi:heavy metal translocating P-type ATPase
MKKISALWVFLKKYKLFAFALLSLVIGIILYFSNLPKEAKYLLSFIAIVETIPLLWGMFQDLRVGTYGIDILAATAIVSSVALNQYWAAIVIVIMLTGGEALEDYAEHRAETELDALLKRAPQIAHILRGGKVMDVKVSKVEIGNKIIIKPGELVPVDAVIIEGSASFDQSSLTGESVPVSKGIGDSLLSGSVNMDGAITAKALRPASDSQYEQIIKLVKSAQNSQTPFVRLADRYSIPFTAIAFMIAIGAWIISHQSIRFVEVLVVATPCPLILAAPIAVISGMSRAAKNGIIIKTGGALERLAEAKSIAFDKTGTLTTGIANIKEIKAFGKNKKSEVLRLASSLEQNSNHVLALSIVNEAKRLKIKLSKAVGVKNFSGTGMSGKVSGRLVYVGNISMMLNHGVEIPENINHTKNKDTISYVAFEKQLIGSISFDDKIRPESKATIARLRQLGFKNMILITGDLESKARSVAKVLGIDKVVAGALPGDKINAIEQDNLRPVVFVGDGVNDAPVLTAADVGIALGAQGQTAASESADMVIMLDDFSKVAKAREIAKRTFSIAQQSILIGIAMSLVLMLVFATGKFPPVYGALLQELVDVFVIFNALRAHKEIKSRS